MTSPPIFLAVVLSLGVYDVLAGPTSPPALEPDKAEEAEGWEFSLSNAVYVVRNDREYVNPTLTADRSALHLEARYNYEAINTGSVWAGWNFSTGDKLAIEVTPMVGGVFGDVAGVAPGYGISLSYERVEFFTQGEYFFDAEGHEGNFFYTWSELSVAPFKWCRLGVVVDRTKILGSDLDIRRGPLLGFRYRNLDLTTYWLSPGSHHSTFVFALALSF
jgi:hypothetical protein